MFYSCEQVFVVSEIYCTFASVKNISLYYKRGVCVSMNVVSYPKYVQNTGVLIRSFIYIL